MPLTGLRARLRDIKHSHRIPDNDTSHTSHRCSDHEKHGQHVRSSSDVPISTPAPYDYHAPRSSSASQASSNAGGFGSAAVACVQAVVSGKHAAKLTTNFRTFLSHLPEELSDGEDEPSSPSTSLNGSKRERPPSAQQATEAFNKRGLTRNSYDSASRPPPCLSLADSFRRVPQPMTLYPPPLPPRVHSILPARYRLLGGNCSGIPPSSFTPRTQRHTAVRVGENVICFGGVSSDGGYQSDVLGWNLYSQEWGQICSGTLSPREAHTAVAIGKHMYVYGGYGPAGLNRDLHNLGDRAKSTGYFNDVKQIDLTNGECVDVQCKGHNQDFRAAHTAVTYRRPRALSEESSALSVHNLVNSAPVCEESPTTEHPDLAAGGWEMIVFGGWRIELNEMRRRTLECVEVPRNDVCVLDLSCWRWYLLPCSGCLPTPRVWHTAVVYGRRYMVVFGGYGCRQIFGQFGQEMHPRHPSIAAVPPLRRQQSMPTKACVSTYEKTSPDMAENGFECFNDLHVLDMERGHWTEIRDCSGRIPEPRYGHSAVLIDDAMIVFGGQSSKGKYLSSMSSFNFGTHTWREIVWQTNPLQGRAFHSLTLVHYAKTPTGTTLQLLVTGGRVPSDKDEAQAGRDAGYHIASGPCASPVLLCLAATTQTQSPSP